ncbi:metal-dependent hydrolase [Halorubrum kocurii]|uniref:Putative membrane-bound metal-dependent hydrolase n=1 Tax=Halorubrum kocurii JCM 14978 TaxID=1230456 RepID=M0PJ09_9EURY|nr:metal-dependent hydrolase [Halorubrum kocurii]EMA70002.1 putative membrane-bound metal-dependent hydrolase [Halorubrum kocurii JCM 14978]
MRPIEHLIVALSLAAGYILVTEHRLLSLKLAAVAVVGSQFPDIVDKPLALELGLLPTGRVGMHSLPIAIPLWVLVVLYSWKTDRVQAGVVFVIAYASHLTADNYIGLAAGRIPSDLLWPLSNPTPRPAIPYWAGPQSINVHLFTLFSIGVLSIAAYYALRDVLHQLYTDT